MTHSEDDMYKNHREECENIFMTNKRALHIMWAVVIVALGVLGSSVAWALTTTTSLSRLEAVSTAQAADITLLKATYANIDVKLDKILIMRQQ